MFFKTKKKISSFDEYDLKQQEIEKDIQKIKLEISRKMQPHRNTLPPPDLVRENRQTRNINVAVSNRNVKNTRREIAENTILLIFLMGCIAASAYWVLHLLNQA